MTQEEFANRVTSAQGRMYRIARGYLRSESDCLDAISEAILKAWSKQSSLRKEQYFDTWLTRILIRECVNIQRRQKRMLPMATPPEPQSPADNEDLRLAIDALPQNLRVVTVMHYMEGYDVKEISSVLRVPRGTVSSRLHDARTRLRSLLKEDDL